MDFPCTWNALRVETFKVNLQIQRIFLMWAQTQASCEHLWATVIAGIACQHIALLRSQIHLLFVDIHHAMFSGCISTFFHWYVPCHLPFDSYVTDWIHRIYLWILMIMMVLTMVWTGNGSILSDHLLVMNIHLAATWCEDQGTRSTNVVPTSIHLQYTKLRPRLKQKP